MQKNRNLIISLEMLFFPALLGIVNSFFPNNPGFYTFYYFPYIVFCFIVASFYNRTFSYLCLATTVATIVILFIISSLDNYFSVLITTGRIPFVITLLFIYIFGIISENKEDKIRKLKNRLKILSLRNMKFLKELKGLKLVNRELEERISREKYSTSLLYEQIQKMSSLNFKKTLAILIDTIQLFTRASKISIWEYDLSQHNLKLAAAAGWTKENESSTVISIDDTIEGWVFRNSTMFSIRMILNNLQLQNMEKKYNRNIITYPVIIANKTWGIINIEKMPFQKYNEYSETFIAIITALSAPVLQKAIDYENIIKKEEIDDITGLPSYSQFYNLLTEEINRIKFQEETLSIVIFELSNYSELSSKYSSAKVKKIYKKVAFILSSLSNRKARIFHYKEENQLVILFTNQDYDGTSIFCLEALGNLTTETWEIDNQNVSLNYCIGFAAFNKDDTGLDILLERAENLLEMQRVS